MKFTAVLGLCLAGVAVADLPYQANYKRDEDQFKPTHKPTFSSVGGNSGHPQPTGTGGIWWPTGTSPHRNPPPTSEAASSWGLQFPTHSENIKLPSSSVSVSFETWVPTTFETRTFETRTVGERTTQAWNPFPTGSHHVSPPPGTGTGRPHHSSTRPWTKPHQPTEQPTIF